MSEDQQRTPSPTPQSSNTDNSPQDRIPRVRTVIKGRRCKFPDILRPKDLLILVGGVHGHWMAHHAISEGCLFRATETLLHEITSTLLARWARLTNDEYPDQLLLDSGVVRWSMIENENGENDMHWPKIHHKETCARAAAKRALELLRSHPETRENYPEEHTKENRG